MRAAEKAADLSPTYLRELVRYARSGREFSFWTGRSIYGISAGDLMDWNLWLAKRGLSPKTRQNVLGAFRAFLRWLETRGDLERLPRFPEIRVPEYAPTVLTFELQARVLEEIPLERRGAFLAAARLGLRPGEIRALKVDDYQEGKLLIARAVQGPNTSAPVRHTKNRRSAWMPVYDDELRTWIEWRVRFAAAEERLRGRVALFPNPSGRAKDRRWLSNSMREEWNRAAAKVGVRCRMYEGTKHTFATNLLEAGVSQEVIQAVLRHRDRRSTERYAKLSLAAAVRLLPRHNSDGICGPLVARDSNANLSHKMSLEIQGLMESNWRGGRDSNPQLSKPIPC